MRIAILISGRGSNMEAIINSVKRGKVQAKIGLVLSDRSDAPGLKKAADEGIKTINLEPDRFAGREEYDREVVNILKFEKIDLVCLAGFMRVLSSFFINSYRNKILNVHPALLPSFPGLNAQKKALDYGVKITGATVHLVDDGVDTGPIVMQRVVHIEKEDSVETLSKKILMEEHRIFPLAVKAFVEGRIQIKGRRVLINSA